jgi:choline dehydrogenase-like flavoprotein
MKDFAIIGSGVSGGKVAEELTKAGAKCVLLEAGKEFTAKDFPLEELDSSAQLFWGGGIELSGDGRIGFLRAKALGGTSIVNQALLDRFDANAFEDWKLRSGVDFLSEDHFAPLYDEVEKPLSMHTFDPSEFNRNAEIFTGACDRLGHKWKPLRRGQKDCVQSDCILCLGGCPRESKQSALVTSIRRAREQGLEVVSNCEVGHVEHRKDSVKVFGRLNGSPYDIEARTVVLAGGVFGNTSILLRSGLGQLLPALGRGFACHPQIMSYGIFNEPVESFKGAFQTVKSYDPKMRKDGYKLENVFAPPIGTAMLVPGYGRGHMKKMAKYKHMASVEVAVRDDATGRIYLKKDGRLAVDKKLTAEDKRKAEKGATTVKEILTAAGADEVIYCDQLFGLHLMGGCALGTDPKTSVVGPDFRVHGHPNLFAADSSVFPSAPGINPSLTIMALSLKASREMLKGNA